VYHLGIRTGEVANRIVSQRLPSLLLSAAYNYRSAL
jgi:hypothetical protein